MQKRKNVPAKKEKKVPVQLKIDFQNEKDPHLAKKKAWERRKARVRAQGYKSSFTDKERMAMSKGKGKIHRNYALLYLRNIGIMPDPKDPISNAFKKLIQRDYKIPENFFKQLDKVVGMALDRNVKIDKDIFLSEIKRTRQIRNRGIYTREPKGSVRTIQPFSLSKALGHYPILSKHWDLKGIYMRPEAAVEVINNC